MDTFKLDTSGAVDMPSAHGGTVPFRWGGLTPFAQGVVTAALSGGADEEVGPYHWPAPIDASKPDGERQTWRLVGFSDLAPATLARIIDDCAAWLDRFGPDWPDAGHGEAFEIERQAGRWESEGFPPLALYLGDDGLIHTQEGV